MRKTIVLSTFLALMFLSHAQGANDTAPFDGVWNTTLTCRTAEGALGYAYEFLSTVKGGVLHGERGVEGTPGWLRLEGTVEPSGKAEIHAKGMVGQQQHALGERPRGTPYAYQIVAKFTANEGTGKRVKSRPCKVTFVRIK